MIFINKTVDAILFSKDFLQDQQSERWRIITFWYFWATDLSVLFNTIQHNLKIQVFIQVLDLDRQHLFQLSIFIFLMYLCVIHLKYNSIE